MTARNIYKFEVRRPAVARSHCRPPMGSCPANQVPGVQTPSTDLNHRGQPA
jgi:hypothetical protein